MLAVYPAGVCLGLNEVCGHDFQQVRWIKFEICSHHFEDIIPDHTEARE